MKYGKEIGTGILASVVAAEIFVTGFLAGKVIENNSQSAEAYPADTPSASVLAVNPNDGFEKHGPEGGGPLADEYNAATLRVLAKSGKLIMSEMVKKDGDNLCVIDEQQYCSAHVVLPVDGRIPNSRQFLDVFVGPDQLVVQRMTGQPHDNQTRPAEWFTLDLPNNTLVKTLPEGTPVTTEVLGRIMSQKGVTVEQIFVADGTRKRLDVYDSYEDAGRFGYQGYFNDDALGDGLYTKNAPAQYGNYVANVFAITAAAHLEKPSTAGKK